MTRHRIPTLLCLLAFAIAMPIAQARDPSIRAQLDKHNCVLGDSIALTVTVSNVEKPSEPKVPEIPGVVIRSLGSSTQSFTRLMLINGKQQNTVTRNVIFSFRLTPKDLGQFTVPALSYTTTGGKKLKTEAQIFAVVKASDQDFVLLEVMPNKTDVYQYEAVQVTLKLYIRDSSRMFKDYQLDLGCLRDIPGFVRSEPDDPDEKLKHVGEATKKGTVFDVYAASRIFFAEAPGEKTLPVATMKCQYAKKFVPRRRRFSADPFFDDVWGTRMRPEDVQTVFARSNEAKIKVRPLPEEGRPDGFAGAVGEFKLQVTLSREKARVGDPITLITIIEGKGYGGSITAPVLKDTDGLKIYEGDTETKETRTSNNVRVVKMFQTICEPQRADIKAIPEVVFHYFDPKKGKYVTLTQGPLPIKVLPNDRQLPYQLVPHTPTVSAPQGKAQVLKGDIRPIVTATEALRNQGTSLYRDPRFVIALIVPLFVAGVCAVVQHRREKLLTDEAFARKRQAMGAAKKLLSEAHAALGGASAKEFYGTLFRTITEFLGNKLNIPAASVTSQAVAELLQDRNLAPELVAEAERVLSECEHGRFSAGSKEGEADFLKATEDVLRRLDKAIR